MPSVRTLVWVVVAASPAAAGDPAYFEKSVRPLFAQHCIKCHGPDKQKGGLRLDDGASFAGGGESGPAVVAGKPGDSRLIKAVRHEDGEMPPGKQLPAADIAVLEQWVRDGATWPAGGPTIAKQTLRKPGTITAADSQWWAFQPPKAPPVPTAGDGWARTPLDRFLAVGLKPAPEAEPLALIRRVTFDLTGLPPTPAEIDAFLDAAFRNPNSAVEQLVDRLLASPAYAQRQARLWLDLVRYADSDGYRIDHPRPHAWRYRDYVVRSFAADKPYDRFVREQLAGDEIAPTDPDARVATGYLRQWPYEYNQRDVRGQWAAILNDVTDVTADVFLGLGFGCARCHDHKFDPILQKDYFALQAFFAGLSFPDEPVFPTPQAIAEYPTKLAAWEAATADVRAETDGMLADIRKKEMGHAVNKFTDDIQAILTKPPAERTPAERQVYELAYRQVEYEQVRAAEQLKGDAKTKYDALKKKLAEHQKAKPADPTAMVARDLGPLAAPTVVPGRAKKPVEPAFPTVFGLPAPVLTPTATSTGRRRALAEWLTRPDHPLTARVLVNRVWQQHFGTGLVSTPSDFGTLGDKPAHPALLDHLAAGFVADGWSVKRLHRRIVLSAAYRQAAGVGTARVPVRRLDAEQVRDTLLAVSGELKPTDGGPATTADALRRSVFTRVVRNTPDPLLAAFDAADGLNSCARRNCTVTPTQSLLLLNGPFGLARATAFAKRVMPSEQVDDGDGVQAAFRLAYGRPPTEAEAAEATSFLRQQSASADRAAAWADFCHALLNSNEFLYVD